MTQKEKQTVIKDLLPRLQYGVKAKITGYHEETAYGGYASEVEDTSDEVLCLNEDTFINLSLFLNDEEVTSIKPYLRPMESMTAEEEETWKFLCSTSGYDINERYMEDGIDWLNKKHLDYRNLIRTGLAFEAPEGMYDMNQHV